MKREKIKALIRSNRIIEWPIETVQWILTVETPFFGFLIIIGAIFFSFFLDTSSKARIWCGLILQGLGMGVAIHVLLKLNREYNSTVSSAIKQWLSKFPKWKKDPIGIISASGTFGLSCSMNCMQWEIDTPNRSIDERIEKILYNLEFLKNGHINNNDQIEKIIVTLKEVSEKGVHALALAREELKNELKKSFTNDITSSITGLVLLLVGVIISTLAGL